jgi:hypothetical protein
MCLITRVYLCGLMVVLLVVSVSFFSFVLFALFFYGTTTLFSCSFLLIKIEFAVNFYLNGNIVLTKAVTALPANQWILVFRTFIYLFFVVFFYLLLIASVQLLLLD